MLQKTVFVKSEKKILSKQLFYNIDALNVAINQGCKVSAKLLEYGVNQELEEIANGNIIISPYVTIWVEGNYYILGKREYSDELEHFRIDHLKDITILERGIDMIFGGLNPSQYAEKKIFQKDESKASYEIECAFELWQEIAETFGKNATVLKKDKENITVKINTIPSVIHSWVMTHINQCEIIGPKSFRDKIQNEIMDAYRKYCM